MTFEMYVLEREMKARAEGYVEGFLQGFKIGYAEARNEFTLKMLKVGTPIEYIKAATGWSEEKILQFEKNLNNPENNCKENQ